MSKVTITTLAGGYASNTLLNTNFTALQTALENTLSRDGTSPNTLSADIDMNSNKLINVATPTNNADATTKSYVDGLTGAVDLAALALAVSEAEAAQTGAEAAETGAGAAQTAAEAAQAAAEAAASGLALNKIDATADPTAGDDDVDGYTPGSRWLNTVSGEWFIMVSNATGAAVWQQSTVTTDELGALALLNTVGTTELDNLAVTIPKINATGTASSSTYLRGDGAWATAAAITIGHQEFTATGTYTPTAGMRYCTVRLVGGGGGGGGVGGANPRTGGSGGGGGYAEAVLTAAQIGASQAVTIGAAGAAGTAGGLNAGGAGGQTSLGSLVVATGGIGGVSLAGNVPIPGSLGGIGTTGDILIPGTAGVHGLGNSGTAGLNWSGNAGSSLMGAGAIGAAGQNQTGLAGRGYGGGGSGGTSAGTNVAGGAGTAGIIVITEFI